MSRPLIDMSRFEDDYADPRPTDERDPIGPWQASDWVAAIAMGVLTAGFWWAAIVGLWAVFG